MGKGKAAAPKMKFGMMSTKDKKAPVAPIKMSLGTQVIHTF